MHTAGLNISMHEKATLDVDFQGLEKMDESLLLDDTFGFVNMLLCYVADKNSQVSKLDVTIALLLAADVICQSNDDEQAVTVEKIARTSYIGEVVKSVSYYLQHDSGEYACTMACLIVINCHPSFSL